MGSHAGTVAKKLGRYEIVKHLAHGGMADVLLARTTGIEGFERHVVLKRIRADAAHDERYVSMFLDEARLAASLHHHNIVQVTDIGQDDGEYFFTMEYVHGEDARALLANISKRGELVPLEHVIGIVCAAAAGLHHAHEQRGPDRAPLELVHRDVSPANVLIGYDGGVKVADFGIAKAAHRTTETRSGTLKGKVAYMSPEQCVGDAVDRRSDVFALGILLYELLTVRRLFKGENDFLTMTAIVLGYIPPPSQYRPDLPPELEDIIMKALANKPEDRYQTAQDLRLALEALAGKLQRTILNTSLADYMKKVFGTRPEPWLEEEDDLDIEIGVDFDGSRSGVARVPIENLPAMETARLFALGNKPPPLTVPPLVRAKRQLETDEESDDTVDELGPELATVHPDFGAIQIPFDDVDDDELGPAIIAPTRDPRELPTVQARSRAETEAIITTQIAVPVVGGSNTRTILGSVLAVASVCAFATALWLSRGRSAPEPVPPAAVAPVPAKAAPATIALPVKPAPAAAPVEAEPVPKVVPAPAAPKATPAKKTKPSSATRHGRESSATGNGRESSATPRWNPDSLFPD